MESRNSPGRQRGSPYRALVVEKPESSFGMKPSLDPLTEHVEKFLENRKNFLYSHWIEDGSWGF